MTSLDLPQLYSFNYFKDDSGAESHRSPEVAASTADLMVITFDGTYGILKKIVNPGTFPCLDSIIFAGIHLVVYHHLKIANIRKEGRAGKSNIGRLINMVRFMETWISH